MATQAVTGTTRAKRAALKGLMISGSILGALSGFGWVGLHAQPAPFPTIPQSSMPLETIPLPAGLPAPVERFYRMTYGERIPVIKTAVISGRGTMRPVAAITFPSRFRFIHDAGRGYRHYIETTVFGMPVMKVNEYYVDGKERMELPWGVSENNTKLDQGGNLGMWAEILQWLPAVLLTDSRVRWEPVDDVTALLVVPFGAEQERFVVRFDPVRGGVCYSEIMRYKNGTGDKMLWINGAWFDEGRPWAVWNVEDVVYNVDVDTSLAAKGP